MIDFKPLPDPSAELFSRFRDWAASAATKFDPDKLTPDEKFALAVLSGVKCAAKVSRDGTRLVFETEKRCGFYHNGSSWVVFHGR